MTEADAPTPAEVQQWFLQRLGIRLGPEMATYVLRRMRPPLTAPGEPIAAIPPKIPVIGGDARTGLSVRKFVDVSALLPPPEP